MKRIVISDIIPQGYKSYANRYIPGGGSEKGDTRVFRHKGFCLGTLEPYGLEPYKIILDEDGIVYKDGSDNLGLPSYSVFSEEEFLGIAIDSYIVINDEYTGEKSIEWTAVNGDRNIYRLSPNWWVEDVLITFRYISRTPILSIILPKKQRPRKGDSISLLFSNKKCLSFPVTKPAHATLTPRVSGFYPDESIEVDLVLQQSDLVIMLNEEFIKMRVVYNNGNPPYEVDGTIYNLNTRISKVLFNRYAETFLRALSDCGFKWAEKEDISVSDLNTSSPCYVYLMVDTANGFYKIGISNHPEYREGTLQSEKPTIELICAKQFPSRTIAKAIESALHKTYDDKHLRGEWFQLDTKDIIDLMATLK